MQETKLEMFAEVAKNMSTLCESYSYYVLIVAYMQDQYPELYKEATTYAQENLHPDHNPLTDLLQEDVG